MDICKQLDDLDPTPTYDLDEAWPHIVIPHVETVGCAFGGGRSDALPEILLPVHKNESTEEFCTECGYHHLNGRHTIPMSEAVEECKRISAALPHG